MTGRFDYVQYDNTALDKQEVCRLNCRDLEHLIEVLLPKGHAQFLALTKLEEVYMWIGKALRDEQIERNSA